MTDYIKEAQDLFEYTRSLRRDFHRHPELGFQEFRTAGIVARELTSLGLEVKTGIAKTGVVGLLEGSRPGPVVLLRCDMDALPIREETGAEYASENPGVMHACGHDAHTSIGLTVARMLQNHRDELAGTVKFVFQPAEEGQGGAEGMIADGVLEDPRPDMALALHVWNDKPVGWLGITPGPVMAAAEDFRVLIKGRGGHAALPHLASDPVIAAAQVITALQTIVSRNVSPLQTAVVTVTMIHGGDAFNVIPQQVELQGTIRTFEPAVRDYVLQRFSQVVESVSSAMGCQSEIHMQPVTLAVINDRSIAEKMAEVAARVLPAERIDTGFQTMGAEDMSFMLNAVPGCYFFIGSANPEKGLNAPHHHPCFDIDEQALPIASGLMASAAADFLKDS